MSSLASAGTDAVQLHRRRIVRLNKFDARADRVLKIVLLAAGVLVCLVLVTVVAQVLHGASLAISKYGIGFLGRSQWIANLKEFGAWPQLYGTLITSAFSLILATGLGVAIGLFLSLLAPRPVAAIVGPLVEMLAAIPSIVIGLIGVGLILPFIKSTLEPPLHAVLGFLPLFGSPGTVGNSLLAGILVLTIMIVPIIAALTRDVFLTVPQELRDGAEALGATRWEVIRGVVLPTTTSGITAACMLGFGRAAGEAIALALVLGGAHSASINLFQYGNALGAQIVNEFSTPVNALDTSSLFYLALILLVLELIVNLIARMATRGTGRA
jgi:phosphate transport system permease protein